MGAHPLLLAIAALVAANPDDAKRVCAARMAVAALVCAPATLAADPEVWCWPNLMQLVASDDVLAAALAEHLPHVLRTWPTAVHAEDWPGYAPHAYAWSLRQEQDVCKAHAAPSPFAPHCKAVYWLTVLQRKLQPAMQAAQETKQKRLEVRVWVGHALPPARTQRWPMVDIEGGWWSIDHMCNVDLL